MKEKHTSIYKEDKYNVCQKWSQDPCTRTNVSKIEKRKKDTCNPHYISQISTLPLTKCPILTLPLRMTNLISKTTPHFCHE